MLGAVLILACAALWATDAVFRLPLASAVDANTIVLLENLICMLVSAPLFLVRIGEARRLRLGGWAAMAFIGLLGSAAATYAFTASYRFVNPTVTVLLMKLQPVVSVLAARAFLREIPRPGFYGLAAIALVSSTMVSLPEYWSPDEVFRGFPTIRDQSAAVGLRNLGVAYAAASAITWGLCTVVGKWVTARASFPVVSFLRFAFGFAGMAALTAANLWKTKAPAMNLFVYFQTEPKAVEAILYIGLIPGALAMYLYYAGLKRIKAGAAAFAELGFPVAAAMVNWKVLGKTLVPVQAAGGVLLLTAVFFINRPTQGKPG